MQKHYRQRLWTWMLSSLLIFSVLFVPSEIQRVSTREFSISRQQIGFHAISQVVTATPAVRTVYPSQDNPVARTVDTARNIDAPTRQRDGLLRSGLARSGIADRLLDVVTGSSSAYAQNIIVPPSKPADIPGLDTALRINKMRALSGYGTPVTTRATNYTALSNGTDTSTTYQYFYQFPQLTNNVRLVFANYYSPGSGAYDTTANAAQADITITAKWYYTPGGVTFGGATTITLKPGAVAISDPCPTTFWPGSNYPLRVYVSVATAGKKWPVGLTTISGNNEGVTVGSDSTASGTITNTAVQGYGPVAIVGTTENTVLSLGGFGDSITLGTGDTVDFGFPRRAAELMNANFVKAAAGGDSGVSLSNTGVVTLGAGTQYFYPRILGLRGCTHVLFCMGANDLFNPANTQADVQKSFIFCWRVLAAQGSRVVATTILPRGTNGAPSTPASTSFTPGSSSLRGIMNAWYRNGAPIQVTPSGGTSTMVAVATGSSGTGIIRAGQSYTTNGVTYYHPLSGIIDICPAVEQSQDSNLWIKTPTNMSTDETHPSVAGATAIATLISTYYKNTLFKVDYHSYINAVPAGQENWLGNWGANTAVKTVPVETIRVKVSNIPTDVRKN